MANYNIPDPASLEEIALRAQRLRNLLGMSVSEVASQGNVSEEDVKNLEQGSELSFKSALAIHKVLSAGNLEHLFDHPKFRSISEVKNFESRRLSER